jgi:putative permease
MFKMFQDWLHRYFSDERAVVAGIAADRPVCRHSDPGRHAGPPGVDQYGTTAFLMQGMVKMLERMRLPEVVAVWLVFTLISSACWPCLCWF